MDTTSNKTTSSSEAYYKNQIEKITAHNKQLRQKLDNLERENRDLKKSLYELSVRYDILSQQQISVPRPFDLDTLENEEELESNLSSIPLDRGLSSKVPHKSGDGFTAPRAARHFYCKYTLKGHSAAIYTVLFSPCGRFLASGSFDKSVRIWDLASQQEMFCLQEHQLNVSDLCWSSDSTELLSGAYDHTVKTWDTTKGKLSNSFTVPGFVQSIAYNPTDNNLFFVGSTNKQITAFDKRQNTASFSIDNDSMVNSIYIYRDGVHLLTGDAHGLLKIWDTRKALCVWSQSIENNDDKNKPISFIHVTKGNRAADEEGRYMGVNSYDNGTTGDHSYLTLPVLRVYDRGSTVFIGKQLNSQVSRDTDETESLEELSFDKEDEDEDEQQQEKSISSSFLIATGSADNSAYVFDIGTVGSSSPLLQKLEGHKDRVYAVHFHPSDPILASCSADATLKIWTTQPPQPQPQPQQQVKDLQ